MNIVSAYDFLLWIAGTIIRGMDSLLARCKLCLTSIVCLYIVKLSIFDFDPKFDLIFCFDAI